MIQTMIIFKASMAVASLGLVSTDGCHPFFLEKKSDDVFSHRL